MNCPPYRWADPFKRFAYGVPLILPLAAFYARSEEHEERRREFYTMMAREHDFEGWDKVKPVPAPKAEAGRNGRKQEIHKPTLKRAAKLDRRASTADYLSCGNMLDDVVAKNASERDKKKARVAGDIRRNIAQAVVADHELVTSALKSVNWEATGGGGGGGLGSFDRSDAAVAIERMKRLMPPEIMAVLEAVLIADRFTWEEAADGLKKGEAAEARRAALEELKMALDFAAYAYGHLKWRRDLVPKWETARSMTERAEMLKDFREKGWPVYRTPVPS